MEELLNSYINLEEVEGFTKFTIDILIFTAKFLENTLKIPPKYSPALTFIIVGLLIIFIGIAIRWLLHLCFSNDGSNYIKKPPKD